MLLLLIVSGAVRPADVVVYYRGTDRLLKTWSRDTDWLNSEALVPHRSLWTTELRELWTTDLRQVWTTVSARITAAIRRAELANRFKVALAKAFSVTPS